MTQVMKQTQKKQNMPPRKKMRPTVPKPDQSWYDESLIEAYYESLHPRRTLDQFYYYMLEDTEMRDKTQVIYHWAERQRQLHGHSGQGMQKVGPNMHVMMVDQLWLWIIDESENHGFHTSFIVLTGISDTVVNSFAETWGESHEKDSFDVLETFIDYMKRKDRSPVRSGHDLAVKIIKHCLNAYNMCSPPGLKFHDAFESSINQAVSKSL